jgi:predicted nucleic acid-binding protein
VKLPLCENEHDALLRELVEWEGFVSSSLLGVESLRACARYGPKYEMAAREWMDGLSMLPLDETILDIAAEVEPAGLRSLDALHLATALSIREEIGVFITYDERLGDAAEGQGLTVVQPA